MKIAPNTRMKVFVVDNFIWFINAGLYILFMILVPKGFLSLHNLSLIHI